MALSIFSLVQTLAKCPIELKTLNFTPNFSPNFLHFNPRRLTHLLVSASAAKQQSRSVKPNNKKRKKVPGGGSGGGGGGGGRSNRSGDTSSRMIVHKELSIEDFVIEERGGLEMIEDDDDDDDDDGGGVGLEDKLMPLTKPPAGFVVDDEGRVVMVSSKRLTTIVDPFNNLPLECVIRRVFRNSQGGECMLLCPVDMPILILKSTNIDGWTAVDEEEIEVVLPSAAYALAKSHMHLVHSGFCYTARGGFCYSADCIFQLQSDGGGMPTEGVEVTCFHLDGSHYMIYTPSDPLLFVAVKDQNGNLQIVEDDLLDDPAVVSAIDEETEFNALVEEEAALLESLFGKR